MQDNAQIARRLAMLDTAALSDALDRMGIEGQAIGIATTAGPPVLVGRAFTVRMLPAGTRGGSVGDYIDDVPPGHVVVIDNQGRLDQTVWGDILTSVASRTGIAGTVIDGVCRDTARAAQLEYPIFARGNTMRTGKDRVSAEGYNEPVQIAGVRVEPDDWLRGDTDGVIVVPATHVREVLDAAEEIARAEDHIRARTADGAPLRQVRAEVGYHQLQAGPAR
jgi:regulator of RNase E activity RraA